MLNGKPLICISGDLMRWPKDERRLISHIFQTYVDAVERAGAVPLVTSLTCAEEMARLCDGLVLSGGGDLDPALYGEEILNGTVKFMEERDSYELELLAAFRREGKPVLGICRGCQIINVALGGTLYQDLVEQRGLVHMDPELRHPVTAREGSVLHDLYGADFRVNSTHHQAVKLLAPGLRADAWSEEGLVEAFSHESEPILAVQFHPERLTGFLWDERTPDFGSLFGYFTELVKSRAEK